MTSARPSLTSSKRELLWRVADPIARLTELITEDPELKMTPLRRDVRSLGILLGEALREQEGEAFFETVEELRRNCILLRDEFLAGNNPA